MAPLAVDWGRCASQYDSLAAANAAYRDLHRHVIDLVLGLGLPAAANVLEIGAGTASHVLTLARSRPGWQVAAADNDPAMLDRARAKAQTRQIPLILHAQDLDDAWPWQQTYDVVLAVHALLYLREPPLALARAYAALKPGGCLVIADKVRPVDPDGWIDAIKQDIYQTTLLGTRSPARASAETERFLKENREIIEASRHYEAGRPGDRQTWMPQEDLCRAIRQAGFTIESRSDGHYRNHSGVVLARKT
jgi:SAM-dependent methyltransferase